MAHSSRRSRRLKAETNQQLIAFTVRGQQFAVPVGLVNKVVTVDHIYGGFDASQPGLASYLDRQISVINLSQRLFTTALPLLPQSDAVSPLASLCYLLVIQSPTHEFIGLLVETQPSLIRVPTSAFAPVPATYLHAGQIRCIGAIISFQNAPMFLINISEILQPQLPRSAAGEPAEARALHSAYTEQEMPRMLAEAPPEI
ncbi:MAG: chemotaxis protein CheW [Elainellaceae cyanobacterium]